MEYTAPDYLQDKVKSVSITKEKDRARWNYEIQYGELVVGIADAKFVADLAGAAIFEELIGNYAKSMTIGGKPIERKSYWRIVRGKGLYRKDREKYYRDVVLGKIPAPLKGPRKPITLSAKQRKSPDMVRRNKAAKARYSNIMAAMKQRRALAMKRYNAIKAHYKAYGGQVFLPDERLPPGQDSGMLMAKLNMNRPSHVQDVSSGAITSRIRISAPKSRMQAVNMMGLLDDVPKGRGAVSAEVTAGPGVQAIVESVMSEAAMKTMVGSRPQPKVPKEREYSYPAGPTTMVRPKTDVQMGLWESFNTPVRTHSADLLPPMGTPPPGGAQNWVQYYMMARLAWRVARLIGRVL